MVVSHWQNELLWNTDVTSWKADYSLCWIKCSLVIITANRYQNMQRSSQPLRQIFICNFCLQVTNGGHQTSFKYLLASFIPVIRLYNPSHDTGIKKGKVLHFRHRHIHYSPYKSRGSSNLLDCLLSTSFYWLFPVSLEPLFYAIVLGAKRAEAFAVW